MRSYDSEEKFKRIGKLIAPKLNATEESVSNLIKLLVDILTVKVRVKNTVRLVIVKMLVLLGCIAGIEWVATP